MNQVNEDLEMVIKNYIKYYYPTINKATLSNETERVINKVMGIVCDTQSCLVIMGVLASIQSLDEEKQK